MAYCTVCSTCHCQRLPTLELWIGKSSPSMHSLLFIFSKLSIRLVWACAVMGCCTYAHNLMSWTVPAPSTKHVACWRPVVLRLWNDDCINAYVPSPFQRFKMYSRCELMSQGQWLAVLETWIYDCFTVHASLLFTLSQMSIKLGWACAIPTIIPMHMN